MVANRMESVNAQALLEAMVQVYPAGHIAAEIRGVQRQQVANSL